MISMSKGDKKETGMHRRELKGKEWNKWPQCQKENRVANGAYNTVMKGNM